MDVIFIKAAQLVLALMILIIIHEFGHFIFARIFGMKVDKFYIFFNPKFSLFKWKPRKYLGSMERIHCLSDEGKREYELESAVAVAESEWGDAQGKQSRIEKVVNNIYKSAKPTPELIRAQEEKNILKHKIRKIHIREWFSFLLGHIDPAKLKDLEAQLDKANQSIAEAKKAQKKAIEVEQKIKLEHKIKRIHGAKRFGFLFGRSYISALTYLETQLSSNRPYIATLRDIKAELEKANEVLADAIAAGNMQAQIDIKHKIKKLELAKRLGFLFGCNSCGSLMDLEAKLEEARKATAEARKKFDEAYDKKMEYDCADYERAQKTSWLSRIWKNTTYGIGWLPLGGYCKISGMIDESMDTEQMKRPAQPWEFRSKPAWQRLLVMIAGVLFNFLTAIVIYAGIVYATGEKYVNFNEAKLGMAYSDVAKKIGFQDGDIPIEADGEVLTNPADGRMKMAQAKTVKVLRNGRDTVSIAIPDGFIFQLDEEMKNGASNINFMAYRIPTSVSQVAPGGGADKGGMKVGDRVLAINDTVIPSLDVFFKTIDGQKDKDLKFTVLRNGKDTIPLTVHTDGNAKIGIGLDTDPSSFFKAEVKSYNLFQSVPRGIEMGVDQLSSYASSMKLVFTKEGAKSIGGFGTIGSIFPEKWNWLAFWNIAAFLSVALAFMNILPIPALDGGHVFFLLYEIIFRRKPSERFMETAQMIGIFLLFALLIYANGMDIVRLFIK